MGTGDLTVPKKVRRAATGLYERSMAYKAALAAGDADALAAGLKEHAYAGADTQFAPLLAGYVQAAAATLAATDALQVAAGSFEFAAVPHSAVGS
jgi:cytochrome b pre-mRNA-processing protein 3